jgi:hypothetical protein
MTIIEIHKKRQQFFQVSSYGSNVVHVKFLFCGCSLSLKLHKDVHFQFNNLICLEIYPMLRFYLEFELFFYKCFEFVF